ncbi:MAG: nucleotidyltransferase domain-containing protein [Bdellovibrionota bacterium]
MSESHQWQPLSLEELQSLLGKATKPYWVSGGWAIDLFLGKQTRPHDDLDISISRADQLYFQEFLNTWDLQLADSGSLRPWKPREELHAPAYNIWGRAITGGPWNLQIMLCDFTDSEWVYRRKSSIRGPIDEFGWTDKDGTKVLSPIIQLLYKSRSPREKDEQDFKACLAVLSDLQRMRLKQLILDDSGKAHPWLSQL